MKTTVRSTVQTGLLGLAMVLFYTSVFASGPGSLRCEGGIVSRGDTLGEVTAKCGQPASALQRVEKRYDERGRGSRDRTVTEVTIDDWTFNFGPDRFQYQLIFENGRVTTIESLGYGY